MRKILTRFASVFMALAMILLAIPTVEAQAAQDVKIHFKNTENWAKVNVYTWSPEAYGTWPGTDITSTKDGEWYTATLTGHEGTALNIIFNDGNGTQTVDLTCDLTLGTEFWVVPSDNSTGKWACVVETSKDKAESGKVEVFEPQYPAKPTIKQSPVIDGNKVTFYYECTNAHTVAVAGDMNGWSMTDWVMKKEGNVYSYTCELPDGEYEYKFQIDGTEWILDPANSNHRNNNNVLVVGTGTSTPDYTPTLKESVVINGNKVTIYYENPNVDKVEFMSSANNWETMEMTKDGNIFSITLELEKGDYQYKFLLNGTDWVNDPLNPNTTGENSDNVFSVTSDAPATPDTEKPGTETPDTEADTEDKEPTGDAPTGATPMSDGVIILISAIVTIVVVLGGFAIYLFIKKKNA